MPSRFATAFGLIQAEQPPSAKAVNDAGLFLDQWGRQAERLGWTAGDVLGLDPPGLTRILAGRRVVAISQTAADLSDGERFSRL